jgi:phosphatidylglycerol:prolipoprotein diacylglycerol transferase
LITILILCAIAGGKLLYIFIFWSDYGSGFFERLINAIKGFRYGFVYFGGFIGALTGGIIYAKHKQIKILRTADFFAPAIALGHSIGRIGCFLAGCCYGAPSDSVFAVKFTNPQCLIDPAYLGVSVHPTQLYSAAGNFILFLVLHFMLNFSIKSKLKHGFVMLSYIMGYGILRFVIEFYRADERGIFLAGLSPSQWIAAAAFVTAVTGFICIKKYEK